MIKFSINIEKVQNKGEDADPIIEELSKNKFLLAVFDGMGGAGSKPYNYEGEIRSGAFVGAGETRKATLEYFNELQSSPNFKDLKSEIVNKLKNTKAIPASPVSKLKSSLIREFPTTISGVFINIDDNDSLIHIQNFWAGDSRNYFLRNNTGLQQITKDDLKVKRDTKEIDAYENLKKDAPLSKCVSSDVDFELNNCSIELKHPVIIISATDGCFNYMPSPMHFELLLLKMLSSSNSLEEYRKNLIKNLKEISGDDFSMAFLALGWNDFGKLKKDFSKREKKMLEIVKKFDNQDIRVRELQNKLDLAKVESKEIKQKIWENYKLQYDYQQFKNRKR